MTFLLFFKLYRLSKRDFYDHPKKLADWTDWSLSWQHWNTPLPTSQRWAAAWATFALMSTMESR